MTTAPTAGKARAGHSSPRGESAARLHTLLARPPSLSADQTPRARRSGRSGSGNVAWLCGLLFLTSLLPIAAQVPPYIVVEPRDQFACVGSDVTFSVQADGSQPISFLWQSNGVPVFDGVVSTPTNSFLTVTNVQLANNGDWFFVAVNNPFGSTNSTNATLYVARVPYISQQPTNQLVPIGGAIAFNVLAHPPPLGYQWWFQGRPLTNGPWVLGANTPNLTILNAQLTNAGYYRCVVSNACRRVNSVPASCDIGAPPVIHTQPVSQVSPFRRAVQFTVAAAGAGPLSYQWYRNDKPILGAVGPVLNLPAVERSEVGLHHVVVADNFGAATSDRAHLQVRLSLEGTILPREEATDNSPSLTNALRSFIVPTVVFHGVPLLFSTYDASAESWEDSRCGVPPTHSMWLLYYSPREELVKVTTEGSEFDTVLAVYTWDGNPSKTPVQIACDNNSGYDGRSSLLRFPALARTDYYIAVDGVAGATGTARVQVGEIIRNPRYNPANGQFRFEMAGPYWFTTSLRSSTVVTLPPPVWPTLLTVPATNRDWVISYTNSNALADSRRFYITAVNTNSSPSAP